jgi:ankyrin repeat protein
MFGKKKIFKIIEKGTASELEQYIKDHPEALEFQLSKKYNLVTPLLYAAQLGKADKMQLMIDAGANMDAENSNGWKALHLTANYGSDECLTLLLDSGVDINAQTTRGKATALHIAASRRENKCLTTLINRNATINLQAFDGGTALHRAAYADNEVGVKILIAAKIDPTIERNDCFTAAMVYTTDAIRALIKAAIVEKQAPPPGEFIKEGDYLVSITEVAPSCNINETALYNFDAKTISYRNNNSGETLRHSFEAAISKTQLKAAAEFLKQHDGDVQAFKLPAIQ